MEKCIVLGRYLILYKFQNFISYTITLCFRLESYGVWTTAQSSDIKNRGYVEVQTLLPAKIHGSNFKGAWPAVWMLGTSNGGHWPGRGEIDIYEMVNGEPKINMALHSTHHHSGNPQKPPNSPFYANADFTKVCLNIICLSYFSQLFT